MSDWQGTIAEITNEELLRDSLSPTTPSIAVIRTSDRGSYLRCRRRWGWSSHLRHNLEPLSLAAPLWFGQGFHFALEDFHGTQTFGSPNTPTTNTPTTTDNTPTNKGYRASKAFTEFVRATHKRDASKLPDEWQILTPLGIAMLDYYQDVWLAYRDPLKTFWYEGEPQVEVSFKIELPYDPRYKEWGYDQVIYSGTIDRIVEDENGGLWIVEYKTAKSIYQLHYVIDGQINTYMWAARQLYPNRQIMGVIYQQHLKDYPEGPKILQNGSISTAKNQRTSHSLYRETLARIYGDESILWPKENIAFLNTLAAKENTHPLYGFDTFIRRDAIMRSGFAGETEGEKILMQVGEMLNPETPLYPHPTRDCAYMCPFMTPCVAMDNGDDWEMLIERGFREREATYDSWRDWLPGGPNYT